MTPAAAAADAPAPSAQTAAQRGVDDLLASARVTIDGVTYVAAERDTLSFEHTIYLESIVLEAGLEDPSRIMRRGASVPQNAKHLLLALYRSGRTFDFLAGALVREGQPWSVADAKVTALRLAVLTDGETKRALQNLIAVLVASFFMVGLNSFGTSPSASPPTTAPVEPDLSAAPFGSANTATSSADSPAMIPTG
jgi:hypothetical protein